MMNIIDFEQSLVRIFFWSIFNYRIFLTIRKYYVPDILKDNKDKNYYSLTLINIFHALVMGIKSLELIYLNKITVYDFHNRIIIWESFVEYSVGYLLYDTYLMFIIDTSRSNKEVFINLLHHIFVVILAYYSVCLSYYGSSLNVIAYLSELSAPFTNLRWILKNVYGGTDTKLYLLNGIFIFITFLLFRVLSLGYCMYMMFIIQPSISGGYTGYNLDGYLGYLIDPIIICFYILNLYWFSKVCEGLKSKIHLKKIL
jgi:hypothetical protein